MKDRVRRKSWLCPNCGHENPPEANMCQNCGAPKGDDIRDSDDNHDSEDSFFEREY